MLVSLFVYFLGYLWILLIFAKYFPKMFNASVIYVYQRIIERLNVG